MKSKTILVFINSFNAVAREANDTAKAKGWWDTDNKDLVKMFVHLRSYLDLKTQCMEQAEVSEALEIAMKHTQDAGKRRDGEIISLMHSELSECLEALRHGNPPDDKLPEFNGAEVELADTIIRIMDFAVAREFRVAEALVAKMAYNKTRPYKHGNKKF